VPIIDKEFIVSKSRMKLWAGLAITAFVLFVWIGVTLAYVLLSPTLAEWTMIVTAAAVTTEVAVWAGATILGISALQRVWGWIRLRRPHR
jgi:hypothetical protein